MVLIITITQQKTHLVSTNLEFITQHVLSELCLFALCRLLGIGDVDVVILSSMVSGLICKWFLTRPSYSVSKSICYRKHITIKMIDLK
ncbi:hypothetical protein Hanom_Chr05g00428781 [Helianthus anomalus]